MKNLLIILALIPFFASAALKDEHGTTRANLKVLLNKSSALGNKVRLGNTIDRQLGSAIGKWSFAVQGGAVGSVNLRDDDGNALKLPSGAIITQCFIDVVTAMASAGGAGTIALTAQSAGDLKAAVDADTLSGIVACVPVGSAATSIKLTADRTLQATIATEALTAGKINVYVTYISGE